jgi:hypothetical protein
VRGFKVDVRSLVNIIAVLCAVAGGWGCSEPDSGSGPAAGAGGEAAAPWTLWACAYQSDMYNSPLPQCSCQQVPEADYYALPTESCRESDLEGPATCRTQTFSISGYLVEGCSCEPLGCLSQADGNCVCGVTAGNMIQGEPFLGPIMADLTSCPSTSCCLGRSKCSCPPSGVCDAGTEPVNGCSVETFRVDSGDRRRVESCTTREDAASP